MGASSSAINPTQDFSPKMGGGQLFDMGASTVKYGMYSGLMVTILIKVSRLCLTTRSHSVFDNSWYGNYIRSWIFLNHVPSLFFSLILTVSVRTTSQLKVCIQCLQLYK